MVFTNYYKTLEIAVDASAADIKTAYRNMSKRFHPDVNEGDPFFEDRFKDVQEAYGVLSDPSSRLLYDKVYRKLSAVGFPSGNTIHIPDEAAGKPAYAWHPDYRIAKNAAPLTRRNAVLIGLAVILVVGICTWALQQGDSKGPANVNDADSYVGTSQRPRAAEREKSAGRLQASRRIDPEAANMQIPVPPDRIPEPATNAAPAQISPLRPIRPATAQQLAIPQQIPERAASLRIPGTQPDALLASSGRMFIDRPATVPATVRLAPERVAPAIAAVSRKDTDATDLMVRRVKDVRYGYSVVVVKRTYHFKDRRPEQSKTIRYGSNVLLFKLSDLEDRDAVLRKAVLAFLRTESGFTFTETFTATSEILDQTLKTFDTQAEAQAALKLEAISTSVRM